MSLSSAGCLRNGICSTRPHLGKRLNPFLLSTFIALWLCWGMPGRQGVAQAENSDHEPLATVLEPRFNHTYSDDELHVKVRLSDDADAVTFVARLDGTNVTRLFHKTGGCAVEQQCAEEAWIPERYLLRGTNILLVDVTGSHQITGTGRVKFQYKGVVSDASAPVERMIPGVAVNADYVPPGADPKHLTSYQIRIGPGPDFATRTYTAANLTCAAGLDSVQVLVLQRKTLEPEPAVEGSTNHVGQKCFADAASLANFLKGLPVRDLVIANSFNGVMPNLNTAAIGGTDYTKIDPKFNPPYYSIIGVVGAAAGQAYESYLPPKMRYGQTALAGSLMLDNNQNYFFAPSDYREFDVIPNDPAFPGAPTATLIYGGHKYHQSLHPAVRGGFAIFLIDRVTGNMKESALFQTNSSHAGESAFSLYRLKAALQHGSPEYIDVLTTVGTPFASASSVDQELWNLVNARGGNGYSVARLEALSDGSAPAYTLISSTDPLFTATPDQVIENTSLRSNAGETGEVHGLVGRDRKNRMSVLTGASELPTGPGAVPSRLGFAWTRVGFQQSQDWPAWTDGQRDAYEDLTSGNNSYPLVGAALGCNGFANPCQPIRTYYDGGVGSSGTAPPVAYINYAALTYRSNKSYTEEDFDAVIRQLSIEQGYLRNVYLIYSQFVQLSGESDNLPDQLSLSTEQIDADLRKNQGGSEVAVQRLGQAAAVIQIFSAIPGIGPAFGALGGTLHALSTFVPGKEGVPGDYAVTLKDLLQKNEAFGANLANSDVTLFTGITNDWGKLSIIGGGYGARQAPWYMCPTWQRCERAPSRYPGNRLERQARVLHPTPASSLQYRCLL